MRILSIITLLHKRRGARFAGPSSRQTRVALGIGVLAVLVLITPSVTYAWPDFLGISEIGYSALGRILLFLGQVFSWLAGLAIMLIIWVASLILQINADIVNSPVVQKGFPIVLAIANLGFVLGIIVIAIATILRKETYGVKQILWKLIVMAILVNFGLVIAGSVIKITDDLTLFFVDKIAPSDAGEANWSEFAGKIARAFQPQTNITGADVATLDDESQTQFSNAFSEAGADVGALVAQAAGLFIGAFAMITVVIVLAVFCVMLLMRYIQLAFLLVVLPLAWLSWVFPAFSKYFSQWWNKFMSQAFFAPIVMFFIWLMLVTAEAMGTGGSDFKKHFDSVTGQAPADGPFAAITAVLGGFFTGTLSIILQQFVLVGILLASLIAAQNFGIKLAGAAQAGVTGVQKWGTGALSRGARRTGAATLGGISTRVARGLQQAGTNQGTLGRTLAAPLRQLGHGIETLTGPGAVKGVVGEYKKMYENNSNEQLGNRAKTATGAELQAILDIAKSRKILPETINKIPQGEIAKRLDEKIFKRYGQENLYKDVRIESGLALRETNDALRAKEDGKGLTEAQQKLIDDLPDTLRRMGPDGLKQFLAGYRGKEDKIPLGMKPEELFKVQETIARGITEGFTASNMANLLREATGSQIAALAAAGQREKLTEADLDKNVGGLAAYFEKSAGRLGYNAENTLGIGTTVVSAARVRTQTADLGVKVMSKEELEARGIYTEGGDTDTAGARSGSMDAETMRTIGGVEGYGDEEDEEI